MTPAEFNGFSAILAKKREADVELMKASAYWAESLARTKRLPDFDKWLHPPKPARPLSGEEAAIKLREHEEMLERSQSVRARAKKKKEGLTDG